MPALGHDAPTEQRKDTSAVEARTVTTSVAANVNPTVPM